MVDDLDSATKLYQKLLFAQPVQTFPHFKNVGFAKSAGFLSNPESIEVSIRFLIVPNTNLYLELMQYHQPNDGERIFFKKTNDLGGPRHICLRVENIDEAFEHVKNCEGVSLISQDVRYYPFYIDPISIDGFYFHDESKENSVKEKEGVCKIIKNIRYFYFVDKYGVQWEFEQGHSDIG